MYNHAVAGVQFEATRVFSFKRPRCSTRPPYSIKENRPCFYSRKMMDGTWLAYLEEIDTSAKEMVDRLIKDMVAKQGITEELKAKDQFAWIAAMEQIKHTAEEFVFEDIVYAGGGTK